MIERERLIEKLGDTMDPDNARDFVARVIDAEVARAVVELDTAKHNAAHWRTIAGALEQKLQAAEAKLRDRREAAKADKQDAGLRLRLADEASCDADIVDAPESEFCRIRIKSTGEVRRIHLWPPDLGKDHEKER